MTTKPEPANAPEKRKPGRPRNLEKTRALYSPISVDAWNAIAKIARRTGASKREIIESAILSFAKANTVAPEPLKSDAAKIAAIRRILGVQEETE